MLKHFWFPLIFLMWFDPIGLWKYTRACRQNRLIRTTTENQRKQKYFNFRHYLNLLRCSLVMTSEEYDPIGLWKYTRACRQNRLWDTPQKKLKNKLNRTDNSRCKYLAFKFIQKFRRLNIYINKIPLSKVQTKVKFTLFMMNKHFILTVWVRLITLKHNIQKKLPNIK